MSGPHDASRGLRYAPDMRMISDEDAAKGLGCRKRAPDCYCETGYPYEKMCAACRNEPDRDVASYCVCS